MKKKELLAPAGSYESLVAAVQGGADAVYLSGKSFGARKYAANFGIEELQEAVRYCHVRGVKVYVTVNTLVKDSEMDSLIKYVGDLYLADVDAIIIQDIGVLQLIRETYPEFECHASTQMTLHNVEDVRVAQEMGLKRVVLARELSVAETQYIIEETGVEVETFVHGALCISYSGQCLISSMIGGRSGNRGRCAQACRKKYDLVKFEDARSEREKVASDYLLSPKDLSTAEGFKELMASDIYSYKIEGRMKGPEYTFQVVSAYRQLIDEANETGGDISEATIDAVNEKLSKVFNREYTTGHILGAPQKNRMSTDTPSNKGFKIGEAMSFDGKRQQLTIRLSDEVSVGDDVQIRRSGKSVGGRVEHVFIGSAKEKYGSPGQVIRIPFKHKVFPGETVYKTYDKQLVQEISQWLDKERLKLDVDMTIDLREGSPITLKVTDGIHKVAATGERLVEKALKVAMSEERITEQLGKIGDTPYQLASCNIQMDEGVTVAVKEINRVRRDALEQLTSLRSVYYPERERASKPNLSTDEGIELKKYPVTLTCSVATLEQLEAVIASGIKNIYYKDMKTASEAYNRCLAAEVEFSLHGNNILHDIDLQKEQAWLASHESAGVVFGHLGGVRQIDSRTCHGDYGLNVMNAQSVKAYEEWGVESLHVSPELTSEEIKELPLTVMEKEMLIFGRQSVMMMMNYCPVKECNACESVADCKLSQHGLIDEKGAFFQLFGTDCKHVQVLNGPYVNLVDEIARLEQIGVSRMRIEFYNEERSFVNGVLSMINKALDKESDYKNDEEWLKTTYDISYTNGHLRRGVE